MKTMEQKRNNKGMAYTSKKRFIGMMKCLLFSYIITGGLLLVLAFMLYRMNLSEQVVSGCIIGIYIAASFTAGFLAGKILENRKFIWGLVEGLMYFGVLVIVSLIVNHTINDVTNGLVTAFCICGGSGMLGGMLS